jgi:hypothetical protein
VKGEESRFREPIPEKGELQSQQIFINIKNSAAGKRRRKEG